MAREREEQARTHASDRAKIAEERRGVEVANGRLVADMAQLREEHARGVDESAAAARALSATVEAMRADKGQLIEVRTTTCGAQGHR